MAHEAIILAICNAMAFGCIASYKEDILVWHLIFATKSRNEKLRCKLQRK